MKPKRLPFFQTAGKIQLPKHMIAGKDQAAGVSNLLFTHFSPVNDGLLAAAGRRSDLPKKGTFMHKKSRRSIDDYLSMERRPLLFMVYFLSFAENRYAGICCHSIAAPRSRSGAQNRRLAWALRKCIPGSGHSRIPSASQPDRADRRPRPQRSFPGYGPAG